MSFSDLFGTDEPDDAEELDEEEQYTTPPWWAPPDDELGVAIPHTLVIARSDSGVVALSHVRAFSTGAMLELLAVAHELPRRDLNRLFHEQHRYDHGGDLPDGFLRIGVELADGSRASNLGGHPGRYGSDDEPPGPLLTPHGGSGGSGGPTRVTLSSGYWLWPLPPPGPLRLSCEWPAAGIELTTVELDASAIVAAAQNVVRLWP